MVVCGVLFVALLLALLFSIDFGFRLGVLFSW